jgi:hypothetical protein
MRPIWRWIRRLAPPQWRLGFVVGSRDGAVRGPRLALLTGVIAEPTITWLTAYAQLFTRMKFAGARQRSSSSFSCP